MTSNEHILRVALVAATAMAVACGGASRNRNRQVPDDAIPLGAPPTSFDPAPTAGDAAEPAAESEGTPAERAAAARSDGAELAQARAGLGSAGDDTSRPDLPEAPGADPAREILAGSVNWPRTVDGDGKGVQVATVGGQPIMLSQLVSKWMLRDPDGVRAILDDLILSQIVTFEAATIGIQLPPDAIDSIVKTRLRNLAEQANKAGAPDLETFVRKRLGIAPETLVTELQREAAIDLLASRCVRSWLLASERREFRVITVEGKAASDEVQQRLASGEPFADVARALSIDPSKEDGGRMPPVVRGDQPLARSAFAGRVGETVGPIGEGDGFVFLRIEAEPERVAGDWSSVGEAVEASLDTQDVEDPEYWQWKDAMFRRYEIDVTPFMDLVGR